MVLAILSELSLDCSVIFEGALREHFHDVATAYAFAAELELDRLYKVTRFYSFWCGRFCVVTLESRRSEAQELRRSEAQGS